MRPAGALMTGDAAGGCKSRRIHMSDEVVGQHFGEDRVGNGSEGLFKGQCLFSHTNVKFKIMKIKVDYKTYYSVCDCV